MNSMVSQCSAFMDERSFFNFKNKPKLSIALKRPVRVSVVSSKKTDKSIKVGILGATGYAGLELIRCIASHPYFHVSLMTAGKEAKEAGQSIGAMFPHLITRDLPDLIAINDADFSRVDAFFVVCHMAPARISDYEMLLTTPNEIHRKKIQSASLVANPGCYPTAILLPLVPLIKANLIALEDITIYLNSGVGETGYLVPEVEQELSDAANSKVTVTFISPTSPPKALKEEFVVLRHEGDEATHTKKIDKLVKGASGQALQNLI
ncbi:hypothetical protein R6Q57_012968 [Mikania cordata]